MQGKTTQQQKGLEFWKIIAQNVALINEFCPRRLWVGQLNMAIWYYCDKFTRNLHSPVAKIFKNLR